MKTLCVIPCSKLKRFVGNEFLSAHSAYKGQIFLQCKKICLQQNNPYLIFSAKHGLLLPNTKIQNYDMSFVKKNVNLISQKQISIYFKEYIVGKYNTIQSFCGNTYNKYLYNSSELYNIKLITFFKSTEDMLCRKKRIKQYNDKLLLNINNLF